MKRLLICFSLLGFLLLGQYAFPNNIRIIGTPILDKKDSASGTVLIKFDLAWDNSWKTSRPNNHDAAWIFVKCWDGESWNHVYLEKDGWVAGVKKDGAVTKGTEYYVSDRAGKVTDMDMTMSPGYSFAWKKWHLDPDEDSVQCVVGYFLYRKDYGSGHVVVPGVTLKWDYESQGFLWEDDLVVKVFAIEMVYVPTGSYYLGGVGTASRQPYSFTTNGNVFGTPMLVSSEKAISVENSASPTTLYVSGTTSTSYIVTGSIPEGFPKGYQAFYIMKYEMTQQAYCEFLNCLNQGQQDGRIQGSLDALPQHSYAWGTWESGQYRNFVRLKQAAPVATFGCDANLNKVYDETKMVNYGGRSLSCNTDGQDIAMCLVSFYDLLAYADFSGLRPMTELEYEKACRGPREAANDEYAWGSVTKVFFNSFFNNHYATSYGLSDGSVGTTGWTIYVSSNYGNTYNGFSGHASGLEKVGDSYNVGATRSLSVNAGATSWGYSYPAPLRVGIFADSTSSRVSAGATYWGVMNMSDNVAELCINASFNEGRKFTGVHGCGQLDMSGESITAGWNKTASQNYYTRRGMVFTYNTSTWYSSSSNVNGLTSNSIAYGYGPTSEHEFYNAGMISSRYYTRSGSNADVRVANPMQGIRLVRTENATR